MVYMPRNPLFIYEFDDIASSKCGCGVGDEMGAVDEEMLESVKGEREGFSGVGGRGMGGTGRWGVGVGARRRR